MTEGSAEIAVVGMACRLPGAASPDELWREMTERVDPVAEVPRARWDIDALYDPRPATPTKIVSRRAGLLADVERFDAEFFGIDEREAETMDPQQRVVLETCWAALEDAGIAPDRLAGSRTGVFLGAGTWDYNKILNRGAPDLDAGVLTGTILCVAANRVSYTLDLQGPSLAIDSASSSALLATHLAAQSLRAGECDIALVAGVNLILSPETSIALSQNRMLSPDGRCKSFDAGADGYVRGEGSGVVVLKRSADAAADRDRIRAVLCGSAVNHNGRSNGLIAPRGPAQQKVMREALRNAGVPPRRIGYVEAHATGTALSDLMEAQAIKAVLSEGRGPSDRCAVASVDACIGHLEQAAGIAKLIAAILCLERETIAGTHHLNEVHPHIAAVFAGSPFFAAQESIAWPANGEPRFAAVSSFGFGGTNAHVILREAPRPPSAAPRDASSGAELFTLRAKSQTALRALASKYADFLSGGDAAPLADICYTANTGRTALKHRLAAVASSREELSGMLARYANGGTADSILEGLAGNGARVAFVCGAGPHRAPAGVEALEREPEVREVVQEWQNALRDLGVKGCGGGLAALLSGTGGELGRLAGGVALTVALSRLWSAWGVRAAAVLGHGTGEIAGACIAGLISVEEAAKLLRRRVHGATAPPLEDLRLADKPALKYVSSGTGGAPRDDTDPADWVARMARPQRLAEAIQALRDHRVTLFLELGLATALPADARSADFRWIASMREGAGAQKSLLAALGELFVAGVPVDLSRLYRHRALRKISLPTYPFEGKRYWSRHPSARNLHRRPGG